MAGIDISTYCFRAVTVGDMFQYKIDEIFSDMPNVFGTVDGILVIGYDEDGVDHDAAVHKVLKWCEDRFTKN